MNIFTNFVPNKLVTIDDKDPVCMTEEIKQQTEQKKFIDFMFLSCHEHVSE